MKRTFLVFLLSATFLVSFNSCRDQNADGTEINVDDATNDIEEAADDVGDAIENAAEETGEAIENTANDVGDAAEDGWEEVKE